MIVKKKKIDEMTPKEIQDELAEIIDKIESLAPKAVGSMIKLSKSFYAVSKDEKAKMALMKDKDFRKSLLKLDSATDDFDRILFQVEEILRQKLEDFKKKRNTGSG